MSNRRLVETTLLVLLGVLLAVATVYDLNKQVGVNHRLVADLASWRGFTGHRYHNLSTEQDLEGHTTRDVVCGNTAPGAPKTQTQLCLILTGPVMHGRRAVRGGYYLPPRLLFDVRPARYGCFGVAVTQELCGVSGPPRGGPPRGGSSQGSG